MSWIAEMTKLLRCSQEEQEAFLIAKVQSLPTENWVYLPKLVSYIYNFIDESGEPCEFTIDWCGGDPNPFIYSVSVRIPVLDNEIIDTGYNRNRHQDELEALYERIDKFHRPLRQNTR